ncbi:MAG: zinc metallopeptidase [Eubacteriales bacterium]|nr:zinc metallopeptidase [Eubacteriales bacterium]
MYGYGYSDGLYFALLAAMLLSFYASWKVKHTYKKYGDMRSARGITGAQAARIILSRNGLSGIPINQIQGTLSDNYDPRNNTLNLSSDVINGTSPVAIGIACHEVGHAIQNAENYLPAKIRSSVVPVAQIGTNIAFPLIIAGLLLSRLSAGLYQLVYLGIICFGLSTLFHLVTLPLEFNASSRAIKNIEEANILEGEEIGPAKKVLTAAALTYVAALAVSVLQLLRFIAIYGGGNRRR